MNREELIEEGLELEGISDFSELSGRFEEWKARVLQYSANDKALLEHCRMLLHAVDTPFEPKEVKMQGYRRCIERAVCFLQGSVGVKLDALETIIRNFGLYLQNMFSGTPEQKATLRKENFTSIKINNEYDLQYIMYAVIKALYPSARKEVYQDNGYKANRFDIMVEEIGAVVELKYTHTGEKEGRLFRELGEDAFFYQCQRLIIYVYDKQHIIHDVDNFVKALEREEGEAGKKVRVYVEQGIELI